MKFLLFCSLSFISSFTNFVILYLKWVFWLLRHFLGIILCIFSGNFPVQRRHYLLPGWPSGKSITLYDGTILAIGFSAANLLFFLFWSSDTIFLSLFGIKQVIKSWLEFWGTNCYLSIYWLKQKLEKLVLFLENKIKNKLKISLTPFGLGHIGKIMAKYCEFGKNFFIFFKLFYCGPIRTGTGLFHN